MVLSKFVLTDIGSELLARVQAGDTDMRFTGVALSGATYAEASLKGLTALRDVRQTAVISRMARDGARLVIEAAADNRTLAEEYSICTVGVMAVHPDYGDVVYAAARATDPGYMPAYQAGGAVSGVHLKLSIAVGDSDNVSIEVDPAGYATIGMAMELSEGKADLPKVWDLNITVADWLQTPSGEYKIDIEDEAISAKTQFWLNGDESLGNIEDLYYQSGAGGVAISTNQLPTGPLTGTLIGMKSNRDSGVMKGYLKHRARIVHDSLAAVAGSDTGSVEIAGGRKFSDYDEILFRWATLSGSTWWTRDTRTAVVESSGRFGASELSYVDSNNAQHWCGAEYVDETHLKVTRGSNSGGYLYVYGVKLM